MKTTRIFIAAFGLAAVLAWPACNGSDRDKYRRVPVPEDLKNAFLFNNGTYWIYAGVHSGTVDSVYIVEGPTEWVYDDTHETVTEYIQRAAYITRIVGQSNSNRIKSWSADLGSSSFGGARAWPLGSGRFDTLFRLASITIQGNTFNQVGLVINNQDSVLVKEQIGLVRYASKTPNEPVHEVYELIRYNIVQ